MTLSEMRTIAEMAEERGYPDTLLEHQFKEIFNPAQVILETQRRALEWYSDGRYPGDDSEIVPGEFRSGRRAREALAESEKLMEEL